MTRPTPPRVVPPTRRDLATVTRHSQVGPALARVVAAIAKRREAV